MPIKEYIKQVNMRFSSGISTEDVMHYQKIIVALNETAKLMGEVDLVFEV
jgi:flagellar biosynthesis chaperone FliJ